MALVPCPECHKEVSTEARACPQCAYPSPGKRTSEVERSANRLNTCPKCHGLVSLDAHTCPYCRIPLRGGHAQPEEDDAESIQETLVCPHCRESYIHTRKVPHTIKTLTHSTDMPPPLAPGNRTATTGSRDRHVDTPGNTTTRSGPRRRSALWQDPSGPLNVSSPRYPRNKKKSIIIGLTLLVIVAISVVIGAIWQLNGVNPLEAIISWRM